MGLNDSGHLPMTVPSSSHPSLKKRLTTSTLSGMGIFGQ
jgi:hypothetical protein